MSTYSAIKLVSRPQPGPITPDLFQVVQQEVPHAGPGEILVKHTILLGYPAETFQRLPLRKPVDVTWK